MYMSMPMLCALKIQEKERERVKKRESCCRNKTGNDDGSADGGKKLAVFISLCLFDWLVRSFISSIV